MPASPAKDALHSLLEGLQTLTREHLALARAEIKDDLRVMGGDAAVGAAGVPALAAGYLLLMVAIAQLVALWLPLWAAFGIVALVNLGAGAAISGGRLRKMMDQRLALPGTGEELQRDKAWLASLGGATQEERWQTQAGIPQRSGPESNGPASRSNGR